MADTKPDVGGQAVIEGVMMRSPNSYVVVCRLQDGRLVVRESPWRSVWDRLAFLRRPFVRGAVVLFESLHNGLDALSFAANQQVEAESEAAGDDAPEATSAAIAGTLVVSLALAFTIFGALPHAITWGLGAILGSEALTSGTDLAFHAVDGVVKAAIFIGYLWAISRLPDIQRVFQYHGAEHKVIWTYEQGQPLDVDHARANTRFHPRCGTSFIMLVLLLSIVVFSVTFPFFPTLAESKLLEQLLLVGIKIPMMLPVAAVAYEAQKLSARRPDHPLVHAIVWPGLMLQRITTQEPDDQQLETALAALRLTLWREERVAQQARADEAVWPVEAFGSFEAFTERLAEAA